MTAGAPAQVTLPPVTALLPLTAAAPARGRGDDLEPEAPLLAVDGTGLLVRSSRAARNRALLAAPDGTPTAAHTLFIGSLARELRSTRPAHLVIAWDGPYAGKWRSDLWPGYKAGRAVRDRLGDEEQQALDFCAAAGMHQLMLTEFEADDILAAVVRAAGRDLPGRPVILWSGDSDLFQLLDSGQVVMHTLGGSVLVTADDVRAEWGIDPCWLPEVRALAGDQSDRIPGLPGIGPKRAVKMIRESDLTWPLPESVLPDPDQRRLAGIFRDIMELGMPYRAPEYECGLDIFRLGVRSSWDPVIAGNVLPVLEKYGMTRIAERLREGRLW